MRSISMNPADYIASRIADIRKRALLLLDVASEIERAKRWIAVGGRDVPVGYVEGAAASLREAAELMHVLRELEDVLAVAKAGPDLK